MNRRQLDALRGLTENQTGITIPVGKDYLVEARVAKVLRDAGIADPDELIAGLERGDAGLCELLAFHMTTCHTYFMRETEHFDLVAREIRRRNLADAAIWVAAAASGEEVYSIAITLLQSGISNFRIMASDINRRNLLVLKQGAYPETRLAGLSKAQRERWFDRLPSGPRGPAMYRAVEELRNRIVVRRLNLMDLLRFERRFDFIFCRNVFMYFSKPVQARVLRMLLDNLAPEGLVFMGQTENLLGLTTNLAGLGAGAFRRR